jgi:hypothetical protein
MTYQPAYCTVKKEKEKTIKQRKLQSAEPSRGYLLGWVPVYPYTIPARTGTKCTKYSQYLR